MPIEYTLLKDRPCSLKTCPKCGEPFEPFMRGLIQRSPHRFLFWGKRDYCALICRECEEIVGYESPRGRRHSRGDLTMPSIRLEVFCTIAMLAAVLLVWLARIVGPSSGPGMALLIAAMLVAAFGVMVYRNADQLRS